MKQQERWPGKWREQQISGSRIEEFTRLLPAGWPQDIPLVRVTTCGCAPIGIEVLTGFEKQELYEGPHYAPPDERTWRMYATKTTLALLAYLASQPHCYTSQDALVQALRPGRKTASNEEDDEVEDGALRRPENVVTQLRRLLYPPALLLLPEASQRTLRNLLIRRVMASQESGPGYILAPLPLLWLDVEAMESYAKQATTLEQFGESAWDTWKALTDIGFRGVFLPHEPYSDWAVWRRGRVKELLWQSVDAQWKVLDACKDRADGDEAVLRLFGSYWQSQPSNEDAFRIFAEKLGKKERFEQAEESYRHLCRALELEGREPHERTRDVMAFVRTKKIERNAFNVSMVDRASFSHFSANTSYSLLSSSEKQAQDMAQQELLQQFLSPEGVFPIRRGDIPSQALNILDEFAVLTEVCRRLSEGSELQIAERILWAYLPRIETLLPSLKTPTVAARLVAEGYLLAASLVGHRNDLYRRLTYSQQAFFYGKMAQDATLQVAALRQVATTFNYQEQFQKVLETYLQALPLLADVSPLLRSCIYAALSGTYAQLEHKHEADHAIGRAYEHFSEHQGEESELLRSINASENLLIQWAGENHLKLGRPLQAEAVFSKLNVIDPQIRLPKRIRIEAINARAQMFVAINQMEQACFYLETALHLALEVRSSLRLREVAQTLHCLRQRWPEEQPVRQLSDLLVDVLVNRPK